MNDKSNNDDYTHSLQTHTMTTQSSLSKQKDDSQKFSRAKKLKINIKRSLKHRESIPNASFNHSNGSLIDIRGHNDYLKSIKNPLNAHNDIITINVSGGRYQTRLSTLENYPNTLLGDKQKRKYYWNNIKNEYYFDRHRTCFEAILYFYQSNGRLRRPDYVPLDTFLEEISFFELGPDAISQIKKLENVSIIKYIDLPNWRWRRYLWFYLEYPEHSKFSQILHFISMFLTTVSCITLAVETLPKYKEQLENLCNNKNDNLTLSLNQTSICTEVFSSPFFIIQTICISYFTIEFLLRLISAPSYFKFLTSIRNWIDIGTVVPYFVCLYLMLDHKVTNLFEGSFFGLRIIQILRFLRIFRVYVVFQQFKLLRVLRSTLKESFMDFMVMMLILTVLGFLFGGALYYVEQHSNGQVFDSIPAATYWGIITISTVGYGDMYPKSAMGRVLACACALLGLAIGGMLISVLVDRYQRVYNRKQFCPEQIMSIAIDPSDAEHEEKQDFINRNLSGTRKTLSGISTLSTEQMKSLPPVVLPTNNKNLSQYNRSSSYIRFIITITNDQTINYSVNNLMNELTELIQTTGDRINLKLMSTKRNSSNNQSLSSRKLPSIFEE